jgi:HD-GYP domain-containing protein (c-di-GMP phosphodiesterase class II)
MSATEATIACDFTPLPLAGIVPELFPAVDLYLPAPPTQKPARYRARTEPINLPELHALRARDIDELWVYGDDQAEILDFMANNLGVMLADEDQPPRERVKLLNQVVTHTLRDALTCENAAASVLATQNIARHMADLALQSNLAIRDVAKVARHDFCTFTHSANVACFCTMLARALGISDEQELQAIATAGMLHDLGKLEIPTAILTKPGKLTAEEFSKIKLHPTRGFQMLRREFTFPQLMLVYQHHEKMDGTGYPVGCAGNEIHWWARICAVADVYEALTGKRPYRRANTSSEALAIMARGAGTHFDAEAFRCWQSQFAKEEHP